MAYQAKLFCTAADVSNTSHTQAGQRKRLKKDTIGKEKSDEGVSFTHDIPIINHKRVLIRFLDTASRASTKAEATDDTSLANIVGLEGVTFHPRYCNSDGSVALIIDKILFRLSRSSIARKSAWLEQRFKENFNPTPLTLPEAVPC